MLKKVCFIAYSLVDLKNGLEKQKFNISKYAYICHNFDVDSDGVLKKEHFHVVIEFIKAGNKQQICKDFNLSPNMFQQVSNVNAYIRYFVHKDNPDKYQYPDDSIVSHGYNIPGILSGELSTSVSDVVRDLVNFRVHGVEKTTKKQLLNYALSINALDVYNRFYRLIWDARID